MINCFLFFIYFKFLKKNKMNGFRKRELYGLKWGVDVFFGFGINFKFVV